MTLQHNKTIYKDDNMQVVGKRKPCLKDVLIYPTK